jgi:hypothetical protein
MSHGHVEGVRNVKALKDRLPDGLLAVERLPLCRRSLFIKRGAELACGHVNIYVSYKKHKKWSSMNTFEYYILIIDRNR